MNENQLQAELDIIEGLDVQYRYLQYDVFVDWNPSLHIGPSTCFERGLKDCMEWRRNPIQTGKRKPKLQAKQENKIEVGKEYKLVNGRTIKPVYKNKHGTFVCVNESDYTCRPFHENGESVQQAIGWMVVWPKPEPDPRDQLKVGQIVMIRMLRNWWPAIFHGKHFENGIQAEHENTLSFTTNWRLPNDEELGK